MNTQWSKVNSHDSSISRYKATNRRSQATIERNPDGSADYSCKNGLLGLGTRVEGHHFAPAPSDDVILQKIDDIANPPRFDGWKQKECDIPGTTRYQGEADSFLSSKVNATITRVGDEADVKATAGLFGVHVEGHFFAPAPSDTEILRRISQKT
jgi:hypothetical protein